MGLAEQKQKQRLDQDPQNKNWVNDKSRFGFKMLEKMGWKEGKGLGLNLDGRVENIKTVIKKDSMGIGCDKKTDDNWLSNTSDFSKLLDKLNREVGTSTSSNTEEEVKVEDEVKIEVEEKIKAKKEKKSKKDKKVKKEKKEKKSKRKGENEVEVVNKKPKKEKKTKKEKEPEVVQVTRQVRYNHRQKFINSKKLSVQNEQDFKSIFGIRN